MSFVRINPGDLMQAVNVNQIIDALTGAVGKGVAMAFTALSDASNYALTVQNQEATNSRALLVLKSDGTMMERIDNTGISFGTPLNLANNSVQGAALVDAGVPNAKLGPDVARANQLVNGGFDWWQRGAGPFSTNNVYTADRWLASMGAGGTFSISQDQVNVDIGSPAALAWTYTHGGTLSTVFQKLESAVAFRSRTITFSVRVRTSTANAVRAFVTPSVTGQQFSTYHSGGGTYETLSLTVTVASNETQILVGVATSNSCTAYLDNANLVVGSQAANYVPLPTADDFNRCLRYYEVFDQPGLWLAGMAIGSPTVYFVLPYKAKAVTPTLNFSAPGNYQAVTASGGSTALTAISATHAGLNSGGVQGSVSGLTQGNATILLGTAGGTISVEANP